MRVLYVNHTARVSGGEMSMLDLLSGLPDEVEPVVACPPGRLTDLLAERGIATRPIRGTDGSLRLHPTRSPRAVADIATAAREVRRAAAETGADLVHANSIRAGLIAVGSGVHPSVVHARDCLPPGRLSALTMRVLARADVVVANSAYTRETLGPAAAAARVVHNPVDLGRFERIALGRSEARERLGFEAGPVLAVIAQITPWKGQDDAIEAVAGLVAAHPGLRLLLVGSAKFDSDSTRFDNRAYLARLEARIGAAGLAGSVLLLGEREDVPEILAAVDVLLVPSWEEPFGRSVIEAMAAGVPVLATEVGGPAEILAAGGGLVLPPRRPQAWTEALDELLSRPELLAEIGSQGRRRARSDFGIDRHVAAVGDVYRAALGARAPSPSR